MGDTSARRKPMSAACASTKAATAEPILLSIVKISLSRISCLVRKPTAMYTALVAQQEGEYRYVNSRLLTNAQGLCGECCPIREPP